MIIEPSEFLVIVQGPVLKARVMLARRGSCLRGEAIGIAACQIRDIVPAFDHDEHTPWMLGASVGHVRSIDCPTSKMQIALLVAV